MTDIASVLKSEISRLARKEVRRAIAALRKATTSYRSEIAALKRRADSLERELKRKRASGPAPSAAQARGQAAAPAEGDGSDTRMRFSAKGFAAQRRRLGLSASDCGVLLGASGQSIYNWEAGTTRPRASHMPAIAAMRKLGKREAAALLAERRG
jgi:DNA-binding transcriptional regulator YiaG